MLNFESSRSRGIALKKKGKQLVGLCPFHDDHEPSFIVDPQKQLWNCNAITAHQLERAWAASQHNNEPHPSPSTVRDYQKRQGLVPTKP